MKPKEKAKELFNQMKFQIELNAQPSTVIGVSKECSMIAVDEICEAIHYNYDESTDKEWSYWQQVKREIMNL